MRKSKKLLAIVTTLSVLFCSTPLSALAIDTESAETATALALDKPVAVTAQANDYVKVFSFTPEADGAYAFSSDSGNGFDTKATLYDAALEQLAFNDDYNGTRNFRVGFLLEAGETYYLESRPYSDGEDGTYTVTVTTAPMAQSITINEQNWSVYAGDDAYGLSWAFGPEGAVRDTVISCVSDNKDIIYIDGFSQTSATFRAKQAGQATVTVTTASGLTGTTVITVLERPEPTAIEFREDTVYGFLNDESRLYTVQWKITPSESRAEIASVTVEDNTVATLYVYGDYSCIIEALAVGRTTLTVTTKNGLTDTVEIVVAEQRPEPTHIAFDESTITLQPYQYCSPRYSVFPQFANDPIVSVTSDATDIVIVEGWDGDGCNLYSCDVGEANITVTTASGLSDTLVVNVIPRLEDVQFADREVVGYIGETEQLSWQLVPEGAISPTVSCVSSDPNVVTVDSFEGTSCTVTYHAAGNAVVSVQTEQMTSHIYVTVSEERPTSIAFGNSEETVCYVDDTYYSYSWNYSPENARDDVVSCVSDNPDIVNVGYVSDGWYSLGFLSAGTATLTVVTESGLTDTVTLTVRECPATSGVAFYSDELSCWIGERFGVGWEFLPEGAYDAVVSCESDNPAVVEITNYYSHGCDFAAIAAGTATITITTEQGFTDTLPITVREQPQVTGVDIYADMLQGWVGETSGFGWRFLPDEAFEDSVRCESDNPAVASVVEWSANSCTYVCSSVGTATFTVTTKDGFTDTVQITVGERAEATGVEFGTEQLNGWIGESGDLSWQYLPYDSGAYDPVVSVVSDNPAVVSVDAVYEYSCQLSFLSVGTATVTIVTERGFTDSVSVTVGERAEVTGIEFYVETMQVFVGDTGGVGWQYLPYDSGAYDRVVSCVSDNPAVVSMLWHSDSSCELEYLSIGTATVTVTTEKGFTDSVVVTVSERAVATGIEFYVDNMEGWLGEQGGLGWQYLPYDSGAYDPVVSVVSDNPDVVSVTGFDGGTCWLDYLSVGAATITITTENGFTDTAVVTVVERANVEGIAFDMHTFEAWTGDVFGLGWHFLPSNSFEPVVSCVSDNPAVVEVIGWHNYGFDARMISAGTATVTVITESGFTDTMTITVRERAGATGIQFYAEEITVWVNESNGAGWDFLPFGVGAFDPIVSCVSDSPAVVINGNSNYDVWFTAVSAGRAIITVTTEKGFTDTLVVTVRERPVATGIEFYTDNLHNWVGETLDVGWRFLPDDAYDPAVSCVSDNPAVVRITELYNYSCMYECLAAGTATITVTTEQGFTDTVTVTVDERPTMTGIAFYQESAHTWVGYSTGIGWEFLPEGAYDPVVSVVSDNPDVVTITGFYDYYCDFTGASAGTANITVTTAQGFTATLPVTVETLPEQATGLQVYTAYGSIGYVGEQRDLIWYFEPVEELRENIVSVQSDNLDVVTVTGFDEWNATLSFIGEGTATITVTSVNGLVATYTVTVKPAPVLEADAAYTVTADDNYYKYFAFTPTESGTYVFTSASDFEEVDTVAFLMEADGMLIGNDDDSGEGYHFLLTANLVGGFTYYLRVWTYGFGYGPGQGGGGPVGDYTVTVTKKETETPTLVGMTIQSLPYKTEYNQGDTLETDGLSLLLTYSDGSEQTVTEGYTVSGYDATVAGMQTVSVHYGNYTAEFTVVITEFTPGDVNCDGVVNNKDLGRIMEYANGRDIAISERAADVNYDGTVDNKDLGLLLRYLNGWDVTLQ